MKWTDSAWILLFVTTGVLAQNASPAASQPTASQPAATQPAELDGSLDDQDAKVVDLQRSLLADLDRIRSEAVSLLAQFGRSTSAQQLSVAQQLDGLTKRCQTLTAKLSGQTDRLELAHVALQIRYCLASGEGDTKLTLDRIDQLRALARWTRRLGFWEVDELGRFWLLQADLMAMKFEAIDMAAYQRQVIARLERYLSGPKLAATDIAADDDAGSKGPQSPAVSSMLDSARLVLLRLYRQIGVTVRACDLAEQLRVCMHRGHKASRTFLDRVIGDCSLLDKRFDAQFMTDDGTVWSSAAHHGKLVLLHFWASWARPSVEIVDQLSLKYAKLSQRGLSVLSINLDASQEDDVARLSVDWPTVSQSSGEPQLSELFQVKSLPKFILIDPQGHVAAVGDGLGVLDGTYGLADADRFDHAIASGVARNDPSDQVDQAPGQKKASGSATTQPVGSITPEWGTQQATQGSQVDP